MKMSLSESPVKSPISAGPCKNCLNKYEKWLSIRFLEFHDSWLEGRVRITDKWKIVITSSGQDIACKVQFVLKGFGKRLNHDLVGPACEFHANNMSLFCKRFSLLQINPTVIYKYKPVHYF